MSIHKLQQIRSCLLQSKEALEILSVEEPNLQHACDSIGDAIANIHIAISIIPASSIINEHGDDNFSIPEECKHLEL